MLTQRALSVKAQMKKNNVQTKKYLFHMKQQAPYSSLFIIRCSPPGFFPRIHFEITMMSSMTNPQTRKSPSMPFHIISKDAYRSFVLNILPPYRYRMTRLRTSPLAATDAICPETLALTACIKNIFSGSSLSAIF